MKEAIQGFEIAVLETAVHKRAVYVETAIDGKGVLEGTDLKARDEMVSLTKEILTIAEKYQLTKSTTAA